MTDVQIRPEAGELGGVLAAGDLHAALTDPVLESMNFLNEIATRFPDAVSFAAGRPYEEFFDVEDVHHYLRRYCDHLRAECGYSDRQVNRVLLQYGRTKGVIHELVARNLAVDEGMSVAPESIVVTVGCQEAMFLVLRALRASDRDVLLAVTPNYVGISGAAQLVDLPVLPVAGGPDGIDLADLDRVLAHARRCGMRPRALYLVLDFANPSGARIDLDTRLRLLAAWMVWRRGFPATAGSARGCGGIPRMVVSSSCSPCRCGSTISYWSTPPAGTVSCGHRCTTSTLAREASTRSGSRSACSPRSGSTAAWTGSRRC